MPTTIRDCPSILALFDFARTKFDKRDLRNIVPNDPGCWGYIDAYSEIVDTGIEPLRYEGGLYLDFYIRECLSVPCRRYPWFCALKSALSILGGDSDLALADCMLDLVAITKSDTKEAALLDPFVRSITSELLIYFRKEKNFREIALCTICETLTCPLTVKELDSRCEELQRLGNLFQIEFDEENGWLPNPWYVDKPFFVWPAFLMHPRSLVQETPTWLELVDRYFPTNTSLAKKTKRHLLAEGEAWTKDPRGRRRLSQRDQDMNM